MKPNTYSTFPSSLSTDCQPLDWRGSSLFQPSSKSKTKQPKKAKQKKKTDPTKPKRMLNTYNLFFQHHRQEILESQSCRNEDNDEDPYDSNTSSSSTGKISFADLAKEVSARWKRVTKEEKAHFERMSALDRIRYNKEMAAWKSQTLAARSCEAKAEIDEHCFDETQLLDPANLHSLASALGDDCTVAFIRAFR